MQILMMAMANAVVGSSAPACGLRQKKLGPAPFASFEDLSPESPSSPEEQGYHQLADLADIVEEGRPPAAATEASTGSTSTVQTPTTPRIDVENASSPSQGESTPEREIFGLAGVDVSAAFLEGTADVDLRSSAEELALPGADRRSVPTASVVKGFFFC